MSDPTIDGMTRREFVSVAGVTAAALAATPLLKATGSAEKRSRVVLVRDAEALDSAGRPRAGAIQKMIDRGICELLNAKSPSEGLRTLYDPAARVGIKTNVWEYLPTPHEVEAAIRLRLLGMGLPESRLSMDDRGALRTLGSCAALVNVRPLRTHNWAGIGGCLKNPIMFVEEPSVYHPDLCADLGRLWKLPILKDKIKLNILVALTPQFYTRGPHSFDPRYTWPYGGILLSLDPVAIDSVGVRILAARRRAYFGDERSMIQLARHVRYAGERHGLGVWEPSRIDLVKIGWMQDALL